jgi:hypothetical protein
MEERVRISRASPYFKIGGWIPFHDFSQLSLPVEPAPFSFGRDPDGIAIGATVLVVDTRVRW